MMQEVSKVSTLTSDVLYFCGCRLVVGRIQFTASFDVDQTKRSALWERAAEFKSSSARAGDYIDRWRHLHNDAVCSARSGSCPFTQSVVMPPKGSKGKRPSIAASNADSGSSTPQAPTLGEQLSYSNTPRPFKNPAYTKNVNRRAKNVKNVLAQERERERQDREKRRQLKEERMEVDGDGGGENGTVQSHLDAVEEDLPSYLSIEAPPSVLPQKRYCDITGLEAPYTDPATGLRYHDRSVYDLIKGLSTSTAKEYLAARGVNPIVK